MLRPVVEGYSARSLGLFYISECLCANIATLSAKSETLSYSKCGHGSVHILFRLHHGLKGINLNQYFLTMFSKNPTHSSDSTSDIPLTHGMRCRSSSHWNGLISSAIYKAPHPKIAAQRNDYSEIAPLPSGLRSFSKNSPATRHIHSKRTPPKPSSAEPPTQSARTRYSIKTTPLLSNDVWRFRSAQQISPPIWSTPT